MIARIALLVSLLASGSIALAALRTEASRELRPPAGFAAIADPHARSRALFYELGKVFMSPRCLNCHPRTDRPTQTDAMRAHQPWVVRGVDGHGAPGLPCAACHHDRNFDPAHVPGAPHWGLAPAGMAWQGKPIGEICRQLKDPARNGGRDLKALQAHVAHDELVGWAWHPGGGRTPAPGTQAQAGALFQAWVQAGADCPA